jgi:hypothetical protein
MVIATHGLRVVRYVMLLRATIKLGVVPARGTVLVHVYKKARHASWPWRRDGANNTMYSILANTIRYIPSANMVRMRPDRNLRSRECVVGGVGERWGWCWRKKKGGLALVQIRPFKAPAANEKPMTCAI